MQIELGLSRGLSQGPRGRVRPGSGPKSSISGPTPPPEKPKNQSNCIGVTPGVFSMCLVVLLGLRAGLPSRPYLGVCIPVAALLFGSNQCCTQRLHGDPVCGAARTTCCCSQAVGTKLKNTICLALTSVEWHCGSTAALGAGSRQPPDLSPYGLGGPWV
jgi:hypothetical protein